MRALQAFHDLGINLLHIESRPSNTSENESDFFVDIECDMHQLQQVGVLLRREVQTMVIGSYQKKENEFSPPIPISATASFGEWGFIG